MTETIIERVARAIYERRGLLKPVEAFPTNAPWAQRALEEARAAIEAMREPTEEMERAGLETGEFENGICVTSASAPGNVWSAMIDEALK